MLEATQNGLYWAKLYQSPKLTVVEMREGVILAIGLAGEIPPEEVELLAPVSPAVDGSTVRSSPR